MSVIALRDDGPPPPAILVGTDFSAGAENAVERSIQIARAIGAPLHVLHASSRLPGRLLKVLVVGPGRSRGADTIIGSTAERLAGSVRAPVLLVRSPARRAYRGVIIAADARMDLGAAVEAAAIVAPGRELSVVHACAGPFETTLRLQGTGEADIQVYRRESRRQARAVLRSHLEQAKLDPGCLVLRLGDPSRVIRREEQRRRGALVVLQRGRSEVGHLLGSVTRSVVAHGTFDLLLT